MKSEMKGGFEVSDFKMPGMSGKGKKGGSNKLVGGGPGDKTTLVVTEGSEEGQYSVKIISDPAATVDTVPPPADAATVDTVPPPADAAVVEEEEDNTIGGKRRKRKTAAKKSKKSKKSKKGSTRKARKGRK
jgi:hypothetical protein